MHTIRSNALALSYGWHQRTCWFYFNVQLLFRVFMVNYYFSCQHILVFGLSHSDFTSISIPWQCAREGRNSLGTLYFTFCSSSSISRLPIFTFWSCEWKTRVCDFSTSYFTGPLFGSVLFGCRFWLHTCIMVQPKPHNWLYWLYWLYWLCWLYGCLVVWLNFQSHFWDLFVLFQFLHKAESQH